MAHQIKITPSKTYKSVATLERAIAQIPSHCNDEPIRYVVAWTEEGRCYPLFVGQGAVSMGLFHHGWPVVN